MKTKQVKQREALQRLMNQLDTLKYKSINLPLECYDQRDIQRQMPKVKQEIKQLEEVLNFPYSERLYMKEELARGTSHHQALIRARRYYEQYERQLSEGDRQVALHAYGPENGYN